MYLYHLRLWAGSASLAIAVAAPAVGQGTAVASQDTKVESVSEGCVKPVADWPGITPTLPVTWKSRDAITISDKVSYRRIELVFKPCNEVVRSYKNEHRVWWRRFFDPKTNEKILTLDSKISAFDTDFHTTILKVVKASTRKVGESWATELTGGEPITPYFRVDRDTRASFKLEFSGSTKHSISAASDFLKVAEKAVDLIAPASAPLLTQENSPKFNEAATFVDDAISSFFGLTISEMTSRATNLATIEPVASELGSIPILLPPADSTIIFKTEEPMQVGIWQIWLSAPLHSFFAPVGSANEKPHASGLSSASILNFRVSPDSTLGELLASQEEVVRLRDDLVANEDADGFAVKAASLCSAVNGRADASGLNIVDSAAASWAYLRTLPISDGRRRDADVACDQIVHLYPIAETG